MKSTRHASLPYPSAQGFTLIELLTVVAIIGVLAAILIPTVGAVRRKAQATTTVSNLRQIQAANLSYSTDNKGFFVPSGRTDNWNNSWMGYRVFLEGYLGVRSNAWVNKGPGWDDLDIWSTRFPEVLKTGIRNTPSPAAGRDRNQTIAMNASRFTHHTVTGEPAPSWGSFWYNGMIQSSRIVAPSRLIMFAEGNNPTMHYDGRLSWSGDASGVSSTGLAFRNDGFANVVYADGHVGRLSRADVEADTETVQSLFFFNGRR